MEEYSRYSSSWMWNLHQREEDYLYGAAAGSDRGSGPRDVGGCEDFGNSLDQLNKIVERITPEGRRDLPKKEMRSRRVSLHESHFSDSAYETYLGYANDSNNEISGDFPSHVTGYEGSSWSLSTCESLRGNTYPGMSDGQTLKHEGFGTSKHFKNSESKRDATAGKLESLSKKESCVGQLVASNIEETTDQSFEKCRPSKNFEFDSGDESCVKTKRRSPESRESPGTRHAEGSNIDEQDSKRRMQSPGWSNSKQLLEIGKYTEAGGKNPNGATSPHDSIGQVTNYGESSMNYDSLSSMSVGGNLAYVSPAEQTMSDCADAKMDDDLKLYTCSQCSYRAVKKGQLRKHMSVHGLFLCAHCEFSSEDGDGLETHRRAHHPGLCGRKLCKKCRVLYQGDELKEHERRCSGEKQRWPCPTCDKEFKFLSVMKAHMRKWHPSDASPAAGDPGLGDGFPPMADSTTEEVTGASDLDSERGPAAKDVRGTETENSFLCGDCDKAFTSRWMLSNHRLQHCADVPFFCDANGCGTTFRSDKDLNVHRMKVHELGPKKYPCLHPDCSMQFAKYGHYKRHKQTHLVGERKFKCDWPKCGKAFSHTDNLKVHHRRHTDEKPYKCQRCESAYRQKSGLKYHMEKVHDERSTGRPGRKRKVVDPIQDELEGLETMRTDKAVTPGRGGCVEEPYDCSVSGILNGSDHRSRKMAGIELLLKKPRLVSREDEDVEICKTAAFLKRETETDAKDGDETDDLTTFETTSAPNGKPATGGSSRLGEIGLNDEWIIDEPFSDIDVKKENEETKKRGKAQVVDSSTDFRCSSPRMDPLDVDLGEELRRLSDVISGEIRSSRCAEDNLSEFIAGEHMNVPQESSEAYLQRFAVPLSMQGSYKHHPDLFREIPSQADDHVPYAAKYRLSLGDQSYNQFCCNSAPDDKSEIGAYSAGEFGVRLRPDLGVVAPNDPRGASGRRMAYGDSGGIRAWLPSDTGDDASPASGRSTRSELSLATGGDIADHYREAHTALLPTCSPVVQHQAAGDGPASRTHPMSSSWPRSFEDEEEEDDDDQEEEDEDDDDAGREGRWTNHREDLCQVPFPYHPMSGKGSREVTQSVGAMESTSGAMQASNYPTDRSPLVWSTGKAHESAFSPRMQGPGVVYNVSPSGGPSGWGMDDTALINYRPEIGSFASYKRTDSYGIRGMDKYPPGAAMGLRGETFEAGACEPDYYPGFHHRALSDPQAYRRYGPSTGYLHQRYGPANTGPYNGPGRAWTGLALPEDPAMPPDARGSVLSPVYPPTSMLYPATPPYF